MAFVMLANSQKPSGSQSIAKWKIEDVVNSYSAKNDTVYVVNFWATFCKPCNEEIPDFIKIVEKYKSQKVKLLLVSLDLPSYVPVKLPAFIKKNNYKTNHVWLNETNADHFCPMIDAKWSGAIPSTIIVNNNTGYKKFVEDQMSAVDFEKILKEAIGGNAFYKYAAPMNDAEVIDNESIGHILDAQPMDYVKFKSNDSSVYSVAGGKVKTIARIENMKVVIIENENNFHTYSNFESTILKTGDIVKANQFIGFALKDLNGDRYAIDLYLNDNKGESIKLTKGNFANQKDKRLRDHSIEINEPQ